MTVALRCAIVGSLLLFTTIPALADPPEVPTREALRSAMRPVLRRLAGCYSGPPQHHPFSCERRTTAILRVSARGSLLEARLESEPGPLDERVSACAIATLREVAFPRARRAYRVSYPIGFLLAW